MIEARGMAQEAGRGRTGIRRELGNDGLGRGPSPAVTASSQGRNR